MIYLVTHPNDNEVETVSTWEGPQEAARIAAGRGNNGFWMGVKLTVYTLHAGDSTDVTVTS